MTPKNDIHNYSQRLEQVKQRIQNAAISEKNKQLIRTFDQACFMEALSKPRRIKLLGSLLLLARDYLRNDFDKTTRQELKETVISIDSRDDYSPWTKQSYKVILKKFYKWLHYGEDYRAKTEYPRIISWINCGMKKKDQPKIRASQILTEAEVRRLMDAAEHPRDVAFISLLYELGARIGEIGSLSLVDVTRDAHGYVIDLEGKTGHRTPRVVTSDPLLTHWLNMHPQKEQPDAPLWVMIGSRQKGQRMVYASFRALVLRLVSKAGIRKRVYPHLFRHTRVTHLLSDKRINEAQAKVYFGWVPSSHMLSEYSHLISNDVNNAILAMHGIKTDEQKESLFKPKQCPRCASINDKEARFCHQCSSILDVDTAMELDEKRAESDALMTKLVNDPKVRRVLVECMLRMGLTDKLLEEME